MIPFLAKTGIAAGPGGLGRAGAVARGAAPHFAGADRGPRRPDRRRSADGFRRATLRRRRARGGGDRRPVLGLNLPPAIDPLNLDQSPLLAQLYEWMATVLIFVSGAYLLLAQGFIRSFAQSA